MPRIELKVERRGDVVTLTLDRPERRNALSENLMAEFEAALSSIEADPSARAVVIAANGPVFSSGHDLAEMVNRSKSEYADLFGRCSRAMQMIRRLPMPVIARVQGPALAAGCQLVAACDLAVAAEGATFSTPGVKIGLFCSTPMVPLVRAIPPRAALEMLMTGAPISAARAQELGLVNRVVPVDGLDAVVDEWVVAIRASSPMVIRLGKAAFYEGLALDEPSAYAQATATMIDNATRRDAQEGIAAFLGKRRPEWTGS